MKNKFGLRFKFVVGIFIIGISIMVTGLITGVRTYSNSIMRNYNDLAYQVAEVAQGYFTEEELAYYAELTYQYNHGEATAEDIEKVIQSERYQEIKGLLDKLRDSMAANDIYVFVFDMEVLENYDAEADARNEWNPIYYVADSYHIPEQQLVLGDKGPIVPEYIDEMINIYYKGQRLDYYFISEGQFGYNTSAAFPVVQDGKTVVFIGVEIPMATLQDDTYTFVTQVMIVTGITVILLLIIGIAFLVRTMIRPIVLVSSEAEHFVEDNNRISENLDKIKTHDEIQTLSENLLKLEIGINEYIENLTAVTAEKERIGAELNVATQIQADMLPSIFPAFPDRKEFDIYATMTPAKEVGGDFYDFFLVDDDHLAMVMADVSGKGVPAALFMVIAKTLIKNRTQMGGSPAEILGFVNEQLCEGNEAELFVTVWLAILDLSTGKGMAANAGHEHPVLRRSGGSYELVKYRHSPAVASIEGIRFREHEFELYPGDSLYVYTDGVPEATDGNDELFGTDRMLDALNRRPCASAEELLLGVKEEIDYFVGDAPQFDDITMLCLNYYGKEGKCQ